jgi:hypothetical protein
MAVRVLIKVLTAATDGGANQPFTQAHVTFIPSSLIREDPADPLVRQAKLGVSDIVTCRQGC